MTHTHRTHLDPLGRPSTHSQRRSCTVSDRQWQPASARNICTVPSRREGPAESSSAYTARNCLWHLSRTLLGSRSTAHCHLVAFRLGSRVLRTPCTFCRPWTMRYAGSERSCFCRVLRSGPRCKRDTWKGYCLGTRAVIYVLVTNHRIGATIMSKPIGPTLPQNCSAEELL